jgi:D-alanyl-D-alanine carboxypeptidase
MAVQRTTTALRSRTATLAAAIALLVAPAGAASAPPGPRLQRAVDALVAAGVPGVAVVVRDGDRTLRAAGGYGNLAAHTPVRPTDRFRIGSIAKSFVATVVLQLVGEHKLSLEDTVERWLPGLVPNGDRITVRQLLGHRSGLFDFSADPRVLRPYLNGRPGYYWSPRRLVGIAVSHHPLFAPDTGVSYSSTGYVLLGLVVEAVTGASMGAELQRRIFDPLGLRGTSFVTSTRIEGPHAHGYLVVPGKPLQDVTAISPSFYWTSGNIVSTAGDVARFYGALFRGRLLTPALMRAMTATAADRRGVHWGLGVATGRLACGSAWGHDGAVPGYDSVAYSSRDGRRQAVVLANSITFDDRVGGPAAQRALRRLVTTAYCG